MGVFHLFSTGSDSEGWTPPPAPNPNPFNFKILRAVEAGNKYVVAEVEYPDANTYEGRKILVLSDMTIRNLKNLRQLDPHFMKSGKVEARFRPTPTGWDDACWYAARRAER